VRCGPATIELTVDGFYALIYQKLGWPRQLVALKRDDILAEPAVPAAAPRASGLSGWFRKWGKAPWRRPRQTNAGAAKGRRIARKSTARCVYVFFI
jgi:hypothetical protein